MRSDSDMGGQPAPKTFVEEARRRQIVDTAIGIIADRGMSSASLAEIAKGVGCSKGVISYHFAGKDELIEEILSRLLREPAEFIKARVDACHRAADKLRAYVQGNFDFMRDHRNHYLALVELWGKRSSPLGHNRFNSDVYEPSRKYLTRILEAGQAAGEIRDLALSTMSSVIQGTIDGVMLQWVFDATAVDLDAAVTEIVDMIGTHVIKPNGEFAV